MLKVERIKKMKTIRTTERFRYMERASAKYRISHNHGYRVMCFLVVTMCLIVPATQAGKPDMIDVIYDGWKEIEGTTLWLGVFNSPEDAAKAHREFICDPRTGKPYDHVFATSPDGNRTWDIGRAVLNNLGVDVSNAGLPTKVYFEELHVHSQANDVALNKLANGEIKAGVLHCYAPPGGSSILRGWISKHHDGLAKADRLNVYINEEPIPGAIPNLQIVEGSGTPSLGLRIPIGPGYFPETSIHYFHKGSGPEGKSRVIQKKSQDVTWFHHYESTASGHPFSDYQKNIYENSSIMFQSGLSTAQAPKARFRRKSVLYLVFVGPGSNPTLSSNAP